MLEKILKVVAFRMKRENDYFVLKQIYQIKLKTLAWI